VPFLSLIKKKRSNSKTNVQADATKIKFSEHKKLKPSVIKTKIIEKSRVVSIIELANAFLVLDFKKTKNNKKNTINISIRYF